MKKGEYISLRGTYGKTLVNLGEKNPDLVVLDADLAKSTKTLLFGQKFPERFFDFGLSEQDMISTAAGLALSGKTVFASSFCVFLVGRAFDQVRQSIAYNRANVKLVGTHSGLGVGPDGATHQSLEDLALIRAVPGFRIFCPADAIETRQAVEYAAGQEGPFFIRLTRNNLLTVHREEYRFDPGRTDVLREGGDITLCAHGIMVEKALQAARQLADRKIESTVLNISSLRPLDGETVTDFARKTGAVLTVEDHSVYGGMGSTIAELLAQHHPTPMKIMGMDNEFGRSGEAEDLYRHFHLDTESIVFSALELLRKKS